MGRRQGKALVDGCERLCSQPPLLTCQSWRAINILAAHLSTMFSPAFPSQRSSQNGFALKGAPLLGTARRTAEGEDLRVNNSAKREKAHSERLTWKRSISPAKCYPLLPPPMC
jgi:hypothetical protein